MPLQNDQFKTWKAVDGDAPKKGKNKGTDFTK